MMEIGSRLDSINDKPDIDNISYMNHDKKSDKDKNFNNRNDNNNYFRPDNNFRNNYDNRDNNYNRNRNRNRNYDNNNNFRYYDRNHGNNNSRYHDNYNNYNYNNYRYNNNNQSNYGNNQRKQIQYSKKNRNNYQSYNNNSNNYRGSDNKKVDSTKNKYDNDFNINNLSGDMLNNKDKAFMTTLKVNDIITTMQVDTGSKHTIIPHGLAEKLGIRDVKKSELQLTAYGGNLNKIIGITQVKVTYEGISKYLQAVDIESRKNALLGRCESKLANGPINKASVKLHLKRDAQPKIIPPRRIPYSKIDLVSNELKKWIHDKIIEPVNDVRWASPITAFYKDNGSIRLCADFKDTLNPALEDFRYPLPRINDLIAKLHFIFLIHIYFFYVPSLMEKIDVKPCSSLLRLQINFSVNSAVNELSLIRLHYNLSTKCNDNFLVGEEDLISQRLLKSFQGHLLEDA
ncbi:GATA zinc finger domain-containing protein 4-like [Gordionus sp. m RMFG-2023]|uniref:GATA zinc finger domain-containing protein 4-like n=1 Tax=Gordionus sp. m RMFG-2023 TaxID=3053472 RepID=UPI0031FBF04A